MKDKEKFRSTVSAWSLLDDLVLDFGVSRRRAAIVIIFAEAQRKRSRAKRSRLSIPLKGMPVPQNGPVKITRLRDGS